MPRSPVRWTDAEIDKLVELYPTHSAAALTQALNQAFNTSRTRVSIRARLDLLRRAGRLPDQSEHVRRSLGQRDRPRRRGARIPRWTAEEDVTLVRHYANHTNDAQRLANRFNRHRAPITPAAQPAAPVKLDATSALAHAFTRMVQAVLDQHTASLVAQADLVAQKVVSLLSEGRA